MFDLINEMCELIYVVDIDTYDLLFINRSGKEIFGIDEVSGLKCYKALRGENHPCENCTNLYLKKNRFYTWEYTNPLVRRHYLLKDKLILWKGKWARVEIAFDMTDREIETNNLRNSLEAESLITECARILFENVSEGSRINLVLQKIGTFLEADRGYICEIYDDCINNTYEWCKSGAVPRILSCQKRPADLPGQWRAAFKKRKCVVFEEQAGSARNLIAAPVYANNTLTGYIGVNNYAIQKFGNAPAILTSLGCLIGAMFQNMKSLEMLERLSYYDTLTGLGNRNKFNKDIGYLFARTPKPVGVVYLDVNGLKHINDEYGHKKGDAALIYTADKIKHIFPLDLTYRMGGDEFVIICKDIKRELFEMQVWELRGLITEEREFSVSAGTCWSRNSMDIHDLLFQANEQMYSEKKEFYHGKALSGRYRHSMDDVLNLTKPGALERMMKEGKIPIYYQPKISPDTKEMIGSEALVRCEISPGKIIQPGSFIPVLEESRLIRLLDFYVFRMVNVQIRKWCKSGKRVSPVSVNFSRYTLSGHDFLASLKAIWSVYRIPKHLLEIEITETVEEEDRCHLIQLVKEIKKAGFSVSIDDFGIKNANLSLFTSMDFDILKIDKSLIQDLPHNKKAQAVLSSISDICLKTGIRMIVEGVENQEQLAILQQYKCDGIQGFLFSKPLPVSEFEARYM